MFKEVEEIWSNGSAEYDKVIKYQLSDKKAVEHWKKELFDALGRKTNLKVLDIGCGPGFFSIMLWRLGENVTSVDGAEGMIACAKKNLEAEGVSGKVYLADAIKLPDEKEETYDAIVSRDVVWTLYDPEAAFSRWKELLKTGGRIIIYDGNYHYAGNSLKRTLWRYFANVLILFTEKRVRVERKTILNDLPFCKCKRPEKDIELLSNLGFKVLTVEKDEFRCKGLYRLKYGWQSTPFKIIAEKT